MRINKVIKLFQEKKAILFIALITVTTFFLRSYNLENWVYLESDQARDLRIIGNAFENGADKLPLLGPKASGSDLHLGPIFYYFQYIATLIFQSADPHVLVYPDLFFSILTIPLLYYFLRQFFDRKSSLLTVLVFASSYVLGQFSRFAWNPNAIPFWVLLGMLATLKTFTSKDKKRAGKWLFLLGLVYGVASQLHFILFLGFPISVFIFWYFCRPKQIALKFWVLAIAGFFLLNLPLFINDIFRGGNNWLQFVNTLRGGRGDSRGFLESIERFMTYQAKYYTNFLTSLNGNEFRWVEQLGFLLIGIFILASFYILRKKGVSWIENFSGEKKAFLILLLCWFFAYIPFFYKLAFDMNRPRYWFVVFIFPFVVLNLILSFLFKHRKGKFLNCSALAYLLVFVLLILNLSATYKLYASLNEKEEVLFWGREWSSQTMKQRGLQTAENQEMVARYMLDVAKQKNVEGVCYKSQDILASIYTFFVRKNDGKVFYKGDLSSEVLKENTSKCAFFFIHKKEKTTVDISKRLGEGLILKNRHTIGVSAVWEVELKE